MANVRSEAARQFGERLAGLMRERGYISTQNASGLDVNALSRITGSTYEMSRRYCEGRAIPRADKLARIAEWLGVSSDSLLYGERDYPPPTNRIIHVEVLQSCLAAAKEAERISGRQLNPEQAAKLVALLYEEAVDGREVGESLMKRLLRLL